MFETLIPLILSISSNERLTSPMLDRNAQVVLKLRKVSQELFAFKSYLSQEILLNVAGHCGACELRKIYKLIEATPTAIRLHIQSLEDDGYVFLRPHDTNRRCKMP